MKVNRYISVYGRRLGPRSSLARVLRVQDEPVFCYAPDVECIRVSAVNAVRLVDSPRIPKTCSGVALSNLHRSPGSPDGLSRVAVYIDSALLIER